jgi:hypothetical protein
MFVVWNRVAHPGVREHMRVFAAVVAVSLIAVPSAAAKIKLSLSVATSPVQTGKPVVLFLRAAAPLDFNLKLIAVAPGRSWFSVVGVVTGDSRIAKATIPRDGFQIPVRRLAPNRWRAVVTFPAPGRWRLVIPNEAPEGFMIPPPVMQPVLVR